MKKVREGYKMTELGEIPGEWRVEKLCEIGEILMGQSPVGDSYNSCGDGLPLLNGPTEFTNKSPIPKQWTTKPTKVCQNNDILFCVRGSSTGRMNISNDKYCIGRGLAAIRGKEGVSITAFIYYFLQISIERILNLSAGSTFPNVSRDDLSGIPCILPCLKEQQKIADILSTVDEHIEETESLIEKIKELKKGLMQRLLTKGIGHTKFKKTEVGEIPVEWEVKTIGELIENSIPGEWGKEAENLKDGLPIIRSTNFCNNGKLDLKNIAYRKIDSKKVKKVIINKGDILLEKSGGGPDQPVGRVVYFNENGTFGYANFIQKLIVYKKYNPKTVFYFLHYFYLTRQVLRYQQQTTGIINFQLKDFLGTAKIGIPINLQEQNEISNILTKVDDEIEYYENYKEKLNALKKGLMQKLLTGRMRVKV